MSNNRFNFVLGTALATGILLAANLAYAATTVNLTAQRATATLPDGNPVPMWQFCGATVANADATASSGSTANGLCVPPVAGTTSPTWTPGPTITLLASDANLTINLTNTLKVPTSVVILGQVGGGLGTPTRMVSPTHNNSLGITPVSTVSAIASATEVGNVVTVTTAVAHGLAVGQSVQISGVTPAGYNGAPLAVTVTSTTTFTYVAANAGLLPGSGGKTTQLLAAAQGYTTFNANALSGQAFVAPAQLDRVKSFGTQVEAATPTATTGTFSWTNLKPGTYLYETGTLPSIEAPMGLYGLLIVTQAPVLVPSAVVGGTATLSPGDAYPTNPVGTTPVVPYDSDAALLFSEIDPVLNAQVDAAATAGTNVNLRWNDPACATAGLNAANVCFPAAVNYAPIYFLINGQAYDRTAPNLSSYLVGANYSSGKVLMRLANAGLRTHIPAVVGLTFALAAEDGHLAPGNAKVQSEALLTAGKVYDAIVSPAGTPATAFTAATFAIFDRQGSLSNANQPDGGMHGYLLVNGANVTAGTAGGVPTAGLASAVNDAFAVPFNSLGFLGNVKLNDIAVKTVVLGTTNVANGALVLNADGTFTYTPTSGFKGIDTFTYIGNPGVGATAAATVTLTVGSTGTVTAVADNFASKVSSVFSVAGPGVLANDTDLPSNYKLAVDIANVVNGNCATLNVNADGSFTATSGGLSSCNFTYVAKNSQGTSSAPGNVTVNFPVGSGVVLSVTDATSGAAITDYRWTLQEDETFKSTPGSTPSVSTRTLGTSFHWSHNPVIATGCVGASSCGMGQASRGTALVLRPASELKDVALDPTKHYFVSLLPGDVQNPLLHAGGVPVDTGNKDPITGNAILRPFDLSTDCLPNDPANNPCGHIMGGTQIGAAQMIAKAASIKLQQTPLVPAQLSVFIYEDNSPTNGQIDLGENTHGLGGFNIILFDPAGRTGDPAGQQTYDAFNYPMSNYLLGTPGCPDTGNPATNGTGLTTDGNVVGAIYTCPNASPAEIAAANTPPNVVAKRAALDAKYALAGHALLKNITPARYDVLAHPAAERLGQGEVWYQTETLEGTPAQDAFVGINESKYFQEFGPPGFHTTIGFVNPKHVQDFAKNNNGVGTFSVSGQVTSQHMSHPSNVTLYNANTIDLLSNTYCYAALNSQGGTGPTIAITTCDATGKFTLSNVPAGTYEVAVWDKWLDQIIQRVAVTVDAATVNAANNTVSIGDLPVLSWFTQYDQNILLDDGKGNLSGIPSVPLTVRFRNGAPSNSTLTDVHGNGILVELFPLFNWYVAESDTTRYKQKRVDITVDGGGAVDTAPSPGANLWSSKYADGTSSVRSETPGATSYGVQSFISQRNQVNWIKTPYVQNENGGITGTLVLSATRPFDDQRYNVQNIWAPLIPRATVNLYRRAKNADGTETLQFVDKTTTSSWDDFVNTVKGSDGNTYILGADQVLRDPSTGAPAGSDVTAGMQVNIQCRGQLPGPALGALPPFNTTLVDPFTEYTLGAADQNRCYDGFHNWNQVQAAPYDGRYNFPSAAYISAHELELTDAQRARGQTLVSLPPGDYVVETVTPPGYEIVKEEDKSILNGDAFIAPVVQQFAGLGNIFILPDQATLNNANPDNTNTGDAGFQSNATNNLGVSESKKKYPECVGALHRVPDFLSLLPQAGLVAPFAGMDRPLCDRKLVKLADQTQASADFFVFTYSPVAANATGIVLDDASAEFNAAAPDFGEKASVPFVPVSTKDFTGNEMSRVYTDQWGTYNLMLPSSWYVNPPTPSGYGPNMLISCINDPGPIKDPVTGLMVTDPYYNPSYSNFCYTNPFMPGQATYLDTPVLPIAAFAAGYNPPDCAYPDATPGIARVDAVAAGAIADATNFGPYVPATGGTLTIKALGFNGTTDVGVQVPNPAYAGPFALNGLASQHTLTRHYGFGVQSLLSQVTIGGVSVPIVAWTNDSITVTVPALTAGQPAPTGELVVKAANGKSSLDSVTVTVEARVPKRVQGSQSQTIQAAIDTAKPGDLILVDAGTYNELVIMWKPVRLQGVGASSVIINAAKYPTSKLAKWRPLINAMFGIDTLTGNASAVPQVDPLPGQEITGGIVLLEPSVLGTEEGAGITVLAKGFKADNVTPLTASRADCAYASTTVSFDLVNGSKTAPQPGLSNFLCAESRIDGVSVTGGDAGGGIYVNGWAHRLEIANNRVYGNAGAFNGGVRVGVPYLEIAGFPTVRGRIQRNGDDGDGAIAGLGYDRGVKIHNNSITKNGVVEGPTGTGGAGGGVSICSGTDGYSVDHNWVCGNFSSADGGGIGHLGYSQNGKIVANQILFNQSFQQTSATHGGGIFVGGEPSLVLPSLAMGTGNVTIDANVIRGNFAQAGHGGGIRLQQVNGADIAAFPAASPSGETNESQRRAWFRARVTNNIIDNNVAGWAGGGISIADSLVSIVDSNTIASNDSVGIAGPLLNGGALPSTITPVGTGKPNPAGLSSDPTSGGLFAILRTVTLTPNQKAISAPQLRNNIVWKNRSFFYKAVNGNSALCSSNNLADASGTTCTQLPDQSVTGECVGTPAYWEIGVLGDSTATPAAGVPTLNPRYSVLTSGYGADATGSTNDHNRNGDPNFTAVGGLYCNGSRTTPEFASAINPPTSKNLQVAATVDEGNNYVSLRYGPLSIANPSSGTAFGDYHLAAGSTATNSSALDHGLDLGTANPFSHDVDFDSRPGGPAFDIGADEIAVTTDLSISKTNSGAIVTAGGPVVYSIVVTNNGAAAVTGAIVNDPIAPGQLVLPQSWSCTAGAGSSCPAPAAGSGAIVNALVNVSAGGSVTFTLNSLVATAAANCSTVSNTASVSAPTGTTDTAPGNNRSTASNQVNCPVADLAITKTASAATVARNGTVAYTVTVTNNGPGPATAARVTDVVPAAYTQVPNGWRWTCSAVPMAMCGLGANTGTSNIGGNNGKTLGTLPPGGVVIFNISATVRDNNGNGTVITNTATVTAPNTVTDPNLLNNTASVTVTVSGGIAASIAPTQVNFGTVILGALSTVNNVIVTNSGTVPLGIADWTLGGTVAGGRAAYALVAPTGVVPACVAYATVLAPTGKCAIGVQFAPLTSGTAGATLTVNSNAPAQVVTLTGRAN